MSHSSYIRREARARHRAVRTFAEATAPHLTGRDLTAAEILSFAAEMTGLLRVPVPANEPLLYGAQATLDHGVIFYNNEVAPWLALYYQAHEFAHHWLHDQTSLCSGADVDYTEAEDRPPTGARRVEGYGPEQRREREANIFAREFLLPGDVLRRLFITERLDAPRIAELSGLHLDFVLHALAHALLAPDADATGGDATGGDATGDVAAGDDAPNANVGADAVPALTPAPPFALDSSQRLAAESAHTPLLVLAGPGTGKTRTLVNRILHLLAAGVAPASILALTFSNKAAEELRSRVQEHAPDHAGQIEMGTFHSFGLELLRRYWQQAKLPARPRVLDPVDALFILERRLAQLPLDHYQDLHEPTANLPAILAAISRAKDELCAPARYRELARGMSERAVERSDAEALRRAERATEVASVYEIYQSHLEQDGLLDFGDLVARAVRLLRDDTAVQAEVAARYRHVLVDEYQDVNRACGVLLSLIAEEGRGLWVVGDVRQAIYRWRGAAPAQVKHFRRDFPRGRVLPLKVNYRSLPPVVNLFSTFADGMRATQETTTAGETVDNFNSWETHRRDEANGANEANGSPAIRFEIATDGETEAGGVARLIKERRAAGIAYKQNAVICRTHAQLAGIAKGLEAENVPALYLGDLFERPEVRDLLALLALACEPSGRTLLRVARFSEYDIPLPQVRALLRYAREAEVAFPAALEPGRLDALPNEADADAFRLLARHLASVASLASPWRLLASYLFIHSRYLVPLLADESIAGAQKRLAIYQLLQFAYAEAERAVVAADEPDARRALLRYVRRLKTFSEDKGVRQIPDDDQIDAVRLVTVHAAKGLEWDYVYLPHLGSGHFPLRRKHDRAPAPAGMIEDFNDEASDASEAVNRDRDTHLEEEECLFFVALSRARDGLCLSRAASYGKTNSKASDFLARLATLLCPREPRDAPTWRNAPTPHTPHDAPLPTTPAARDHIGNRFARAHFTERELSNYIRCPRKYFYENVLYLSGGVDHSPYARFHACVHEVIRWLIAAKSAGNLTPDAEEEAQRRLAALWLEKRLTEHPYESFYRERAEQMVERAARRIRLSTGTLLTREWVVTRPHACITVAPDAVELIEDADANGATLLLQHTRTSRPPSAQPDDNLYALYYALAAEHFPAAHLQVQILYLSTDEIIRLDLKPRTIATRLKHYDDAITSILASDFSPTPSDHSCPRCAHFYTCPKAEE